MLKGPRDIDIGFSCHGHFGRCDTSRIGSIYVHGQTLADKTKPWLSFKPTCMHVLPWINFSKQDKTWTVFSILDVAICMLSNFGVISKTAQLKVENSALTTYRVSLVSYCAPRLDKLPNL